MMIKRSVIFYFFSGLLVTEGYYDYAFSNQTFVKHDLKFDSSCLPKDESDKVRVPKFISFSQKNDNVGVVIDFDIPFLTIPVNKSIGGIMSSMSTAVTGFGFEGLQLNLPALLMIGVFGAGGTFLKGINHYLNSSQSNLLAQLMSVPNSNTNYLLQTLFNKKTKKEQDFEKFEKTAKQFAKPKSYRNDKKRVPRFISLQQNGDNVYVAIDFIVPFLSIPVKQSIYSAMNTMQNVTTRFGALQFNYAAVAMGIVVALSGFLLQIYNKISNSDQNVDVFYKLMGRKPDPRKNDESSWILDMIDRAIRKYKIDPKVCSKKLICWYVQESVESVQNDKATKLDKFIDGFTKTDWTMELVTNTLFEESIKAGKDRQCSDTYSECGISQKTIDSALSYIL